MSINTFDEFQAAAVKTAIYPEETKVLYPALGLAGEAGEVANKVKKIIRDDGLVITIERQAQVTILASRQERGTLKGDGDDR